jgi:hypothetical protein
MRIWIPGPGETLPDLEKSVCCTNLVPDVRAPDITDGDSLTNGNIQIHPQIPSHVDTCPVPNGSCTQ